MIFPADIVSLAEAVLEKARAGGQYIALAESCTGGLMAAALTEIPGASDVFERAFLTYSNQSKIEMLGVRPATLEEFGAVSAEVAAEMAEGAALYSRAGIALSVTGIAGPDGGTDTKPVGMVWFGLVGKGLETATHLKEFPGPDRQTIRLAAVRFGLELLR